MAYAGSRVPEVAKRRVCITAPPGSTTIVIEGARRTVWPVSRERVRKSASEREIDWAGKTTWESESESESDGERESENEKESESESDWERWDWDNIIAALEHPDRVHRIKLANIPDTAWDTVSAAMQVSFPELTDLQFWSFDKGPVAVLPDSFLGGSAPRLRLLDLKNVAYPAVWKLDLSVNDLVYLSLWGLPHTGYIPPESMVACLSSLNRLKSLRFGFQSPRSRPDQPRPPPQARILLPALATFTFEGMSEYLEDFVARIDTPMLTRLNISFFLDLVFDIPHFKQFIGRLKGLQLSKTARMTLHPTFILLDFDVSLLELLIKCDRIDWQISSMALVCGQLSPFFSLIERLDFATVRRLQLRQLEGHDGIDHTQVIELFQSFTAIQRLYISEILVPVIAPALQEHIRETAIEVLSNLHELFLGGSSLPVAIRQFVDARNLYSRPIAVYRWGEG